MSMRLHSDEQIANSEALWKFYHIGDISTIAGDGEQINFNELTYHERLDLLKI